nr:hypothetical protein [Tanacetum cinerariifolium]
MESDEFIKSSVENLVPNPSESEGERECDVPACEDFTTFSNILFDADYDFSSSDDQSFSDEDIPKKIYSNPLFDKEIISMKIDSHHFNAKSDLIKALLNHDSPIISSSSKIDSLFNEFIGELTFLIEEIDLSFTPDDLMTPSIKEDDYDSERDILILEELLSNDSLSLPENESFHFDIPSSSRPSTKPPDECSSCGALYATNCCCSDGSLMDKIICDLNNTPDLFQEPSRNCPKCGNPVDGHYCQGCALLRKKFKEDLFTYCIENEILQDSSVPSNDNTNVVNALQEPFVVNQDPDGNSFTYDSRSNLVHDSPNDFNLPSQPPLYSCEFCRNDARYGHYCTPQVLFIYLEPCYNQDFNFS